MTEPTYIIKLFRDEALASANSDLLVSVEDAAAEAGLTHRRSGPDLEVEGKLQKIDVAIIRNPAANPEGSTVYVDCTSPAVGACPPSGSGRP